MLNLTAPRWLQFKAAIRADVAALQQAAVSLPTLTTQSANVWEDILLRNEDLSRRMSHLGSYIGCLASSDARNESYQTEEAELTRTRAELAKVRIELLRAFKAPRTRLCRILRPPRIGGGAELSDKIARGSAPRDDGGKRNSRHRFERRWHPGLGPALRSDLRQTRIRHGLSRRQARAGADVATPLIDGRSRPACAPSGLRRRQRGLAKRRRQPPPPRSTPLPAQG